MTLRAAAVVIVLGVGASGCGERHAPAAATPAAAIEVPSPAPTIPHELLVVRGAHHGELLEGCAAIGVCELVGRRVEAFLLRYLAGQAALGGR